MTRFDDAFEPIAVATRSGYDESLYHGAAVGIDVDGAMIAGVGDPSVVVYPRSSLKPLQATAMVGCGLAVPAELLALVCASHDGTPKHLDVVRRLLSTVGLDESALQNTPTYPLAEDARAEMVRRGEGPTALHQNCSGKHAGMLVTCKVNGWPIEDYLDPAHPLQEAITASIERHGAPVAHIGIDGCGAPTHAIGLTDLARSFAEIAATKTTIADAMCGHPDLVGGVARDVTLWMQAVPGLVMKDGADGVMAGALPDGRAFALKIASGADGARQAATAEALRVLGVDLDATGSTPTGPAVTGHGQAVGQVTGLPWSTPASSGGSC